MDQGKAASTVVKVVEQCRFSPPPAAVPDTVVPLTSFDVVWLFTGPVKRLFFYQFTTADFLSTHLPPLRRSLSLTLQPFFSLAGHLLREDLVIEYADGDSVSLVVAESDDDFAAVMSDDAKDAKLTHPLVPPLPPADDRGRCPVLGLLFTVFPGAGFSLGMTVHHAAADGNSSTRFLRSWAAIHRSGGDPSVLPEAPVYERGALLELEEEEEKKMGFLEELKELVPSPAVEADTESLEKTTMVLAGQPSGPPLSLAATRSKGSVTGYVRHWHPTVNVRRGLFLRLGLPDEGPRARGQNRLLRICRRLSDTGRSRTPRAGCLLRQPDRRGVL